MHCMKGHCNVISSDCPDVILYILILSFPLASSAWSTFLTQRIKRSSSYFHRGWKFSSTDSKPAEAHIPGFASS